MALFLQYMTHVVISKKQAALMTKSLIATIAEAETLSQEVADEYKKMLSQGFWHIPASEQLALLDAFYKMTAVAVCTVKKALLKDMIPILTKTHARLVKHEAKGVSDSRVTTSQDFEFSTNTESLRGLSDMQYCIAKGTSGKTAFVEAKAKAEEGLVDFAFMKQMKRYFIVDLLNYSEQEALERMCMFRLKKPSYRTVFVIFIGTTDYLFFRPKLESEGN